MAKMQSHEETIETNFCITENVADGKLACNALRSIVLWFIIYTYSHQMLL